MEYLKKRNSDFIRVIIVVYVIATVMIIGLFGTLLRRSIESEESLELAIKSKENQIELLREENTELSEQFAMIMNYPNSEYDIFEIAGNAYQIDPILLEAICRWESGHFTSDLYLSKNNAWGAYDGKMFLTFNNTDHSIIELARVLYGSYFGKGLRTIDEISRKYCPDSPNEWAKGVTELYNEIKISKTK